MQTDKLGMRLKNEDAEIAKLKSERGVVDLAEAMKTLTAQEAAIKQENYLAIAEFGRRHVSSPINSRKCCRWITASELWQPLPAPAPGCPRRPPRSPKWRARPQAKPLRRITLMW